MRQDGGNSSSPTVTRHSELSNGLHYSSFATCLCWMACSNQPEQQALGVTLEPCATGETGAMPTWGGG